MRGDLWRGRGRMASRYMEADMVQLREALEKSWQPDTAYLKVAEKGNPALGQCYPTSRIVQFFFPEMEIVEGEVWTGKDIEKHFWNITIVGGKEYHFDFTWRQFPAGSSVRSYKVRNRETLGDDEETLRRIELLLGRVNNCLDL